MTTLEQLARNYAAAHPTRDGGTWALWCASLVYRFTGATVAYDPATAALAAARIVSTDPTTAPIGAIHYWGGGDGHVAVEVRGGGRLMFMASSQVTESLGNAIGLVSFSDYRGKAPFTYRGWARTYGANPVPDWPTADTQTTQRKEHPGMYFIRTLDGTVYLVTAGGMAPVQSPVHLRLLQRMMESYPGADTFNALERDIIRNYLHAAFTADDQAQAAILAKVADIQVPDPTTPSPVDPAVLADAVVDGLAARLQ